MLTDKDINSVVNLLKDTRKNVENCTIKCVHVRLRSHNWMSALQNQVVQHYDNVQLAFKSALEETKNNQLILVCGSFHTLEAVWEYLEECQ